MGLNGVVVQKRHGPWGITPSQNVQDVVGSLDNSMSTDLHCN